MSQPLPGWVTPRTAFFERLRRPKITSRRPALAKVLAKLPPSQRTLTARRTPLVQGFPCARHPNPRLSHRSVDNRIRFTVHQIATVSNAAEAAPRDAATITDPGWSRSASA